MRIGIREETAQDYDEVSRIIREAFALAEHTDGTEQALVGALRKSEAFIPALSLVAEVDGALAGHILFTEAWVGVQPVLALAPLSVAPRFWRLGVGTALMKEGHRIAAALGCTHSLVLGSRTYYSRVGYLPAASFGITAPAGLSVENLMVLPLRDGVGTISGTIMYAKEFGL